MFIIILFIQVFFKIKNCQCMKRVVFCNPFWDEELRVNYFMSIGYNILD